MFGCQVWAGSATPPPLVVSPKDGCISQRNFWGGGVTAEPESRTRPPAPPTAKNRTVLRPCVLTGNMLAPSQRWHFAGGVLALQDGTARCLAVSDCLGAHGAAAVLRPCLTSPSPSEDAAPAPPVGCQAPWTDADLWPRTHVPSPHPGACASGTSQRWSFSPWNYGHTVGLRIQSQASLNCIEIFGGQNTSDIAVGGCSHTCNMVWNWNASTGALTSAAIPPCVNASGMCLSAGAATVGGR
eukprot:SAG11_NODE_766_length_7274_cov_11.526690_2_plen_241_part_00